MNLHATLMLAPFFALLGGCLIFPAGSNPAPPVAAHITTHEQGETRVLVLPMLSAMPMLPAHTEKNSPRFVAEAPVIITERELTSLDTSRLRWGVCLFGGMRGACSLILDEKLVELCLIWPDGRVLSLGEPGKERWERETRGYMPEAWRAQLLVDLPQSQVLHGHNNICPAQLSDLKWSEADRKMAIDFIKRLQIRPGLDGGFVTRRPAPS